MHASRKRFFFLRVAVVTVVYGLCEKQGKEKYLFTSRQERLSVIQKYTSVVLGNYFFWLLISKSEIILALLRKLLEWFN